MSHAAQREFIGVIKSNLPEYFQHVAVLEVGSLDINGSVRSAFNGGSYVGLDVADGKGVDIVCQGQDFRAPDNSFDHVISCEVMEHNPYWTATFSNMVRMCKPGGLITMTCATTGRREHGTTRTSPKDSPLTVGIGWDYYKNLTEADFRRVFDFDTAFSRYYIGVNWLSFDLYFCGIKHRGDAGADKQWAGFRNDVDEYLTEQHRLKICKYRAVAAPWLGDGWFRLMRGVGRVTGSRLLEYVHG